MRHHVLATLVALTAPFASLGDAEACSCLAPDLVRNYRQADHVFAGRVLSKTVGPNITRLEVLVLRTAKSCLTERSVVEVFTPSNQVQCGADFFRGEDYVMLADDQRIGGRMRMTTTYCLGSKPIRFMTPDEIDFIRSRPLSCPGLPECADGSAESSCPTDPCGGASACATNVVCESNFCGGCTAEFYSAFDEAACTPW